MKKKNRIPIILSIFTILYIYIISGSILNIYYQDTGFFKHDLAHRLVLDKEAQRAKQASISWEDYDGVIVYSQVLDGRRAGFYDPSYAKLKENSFTPGTRYFNRDDYKEKANVYMDAVHDYGGFIDLGEAMSSKALLATLGKNDYLYSKEVDKVHNLTHMDYLGDLIYLDGDQDQVTDLISQLEDKGYREENIGQKNIVDLYMTDSFYFTNLSLYQFFYYGFIIFMFFLLAIALVFNNYRNTRSIHIHKLMGGSLSRQFFRNYLKIALSSSLASILIYYLLGGLIDLSNTISLSLLNVLTLTGLFDLILFFLFGLSWIFFLTFFKRQETYYAS